MTAATTVRRARLLALYRWVASDWAWKTVEWAWRNRESLKWVFRFVRNTVCSFMVDNPICLMATYR